MTQEAQTRKARPLSGEADEAYQEHILQFVSRTFALTIPQLPAELSRVVSNAYLLCRIADTVEDDNAVNSEQTRRLADMFAQVVAGDLPAKEFSDALYPLLQALITRLKQPELVVFLPYCISIYALAHTSTNF